MQLSTDTQTLLHNHLLSGIAEGQIILDVNRRIQAMNTAAANLLGYDASALIGYGTAFWWPDGKNVLADININKSRQAVRTQLQRPNQSLVSVLMSITPLMTYGGKQWLLAIVAAEQAEHLNAAFAHTQRLAGVGTLTSSVSHELTNPISIITSTCSNLLLDVVDSDNTLSRDKLIHYVRTIEQSANRCVRIMEVLRNYSLHNELQTAVTNLNLIIDDALTLVSHQFAKEHNISVTTDLAPDLKSLVCDHSLITQVLINLLVNARDAMPAIGGKICIKSWAMPIEAAGLSLNGLTQQEVPNSFYAFSVSDNGHGIPTSILDQIFDLFFTTKVNSNGTGLGLFVSKGFIEKHNGRIWATNNPEGGATFTVALPRRL